jgi:hypothetical protein
MYSSMCGHCSGHCSGGRGLAGFAGVILAVAGAISTVLFVAVRAGFSVAGGVFTADGMMALKPSYCCIVPA